jgi:hypothetical protein
MTLFHGRTRVAVLILLFSAAPVVAKAEPITIAFDVAVRYVHGDMRDFFGARLAAGDLLHGTFTFDPAGAFDANPDPLSGLYRVAGELRVHGASAGVDAPIDEIQVFDDRQIGWPLESLAASSDHVTVPGYYGMSMYAEFYGAPGNQTGAPLPRTSAEFLAAYNLPGGFWFSANQNGVEPPWDDTTHRLFGTIDTVREPTAPVPEPGTLLLVAGAAAACFRRCRRPSRFL